MFWGEGSCRRRVGDTWRNGAGTVLSVPATSEGRKWARGAMFWSYSLGKNCEDWTPSREDDGDHTLLFKKLQCWYEHRLPSKILKPQGSGQPGPGAEHTPQARLPSSSHEGRHRAGVPDRGPGPKARVSEAASWCSAWTCITGRFHQILTEPAARHGQASP